MLNESSKNTDIDDVYLWSLLIKGDRSALEILYKRHYNLLFNYGLKYSTDKDFVKDSIQDLFVRLHKADSHASTPNPKGYLLKSLKNIIYNKILAEKKHTPLEELPVFQLPEDNVLLKKVFEKNDEELYLAKQLIDAIAKLTKRQKDVIYLHYVKNLSHKEIAEAMSINEQSSMNLVSRALVKLRNLIKQMRIQSVFL